MFLLTMILFGWYPNNFNQEKAKILIFLCRKHFGHCVSVYVHTTQDYPELLYCKSCSFWPHSIYCCAAFECYLTHSWEMAFWKYCLQNVAYKRRSLLHCINSKPLRDCIRQVRCNNFRTIKKKAATNMDAVSKSTIFKLKMHMYFSSFYPVNVLI